MKIFSSIVTAAALLCFSQGAMAQSSFGKPMDVALGIERAFGFYTGSQTIELDNGDEVDIDSQGFSLGWSHTGQPLPVMVPRFGFDIFVIESLSVGAAFGFVSQDIDYDDNDNDSGRGGLLFAPRVGYFIDFNDMFGFWPRGGFTFYDLDDPDQSQLLLTLEPYFTLAPRDGWAFLFGPVIDLGFSGEYGDDDLSERSLGIMIGLFGWI
jgi:hypothetical protein